MSMAILDTQLENMYILIFIKQNKWIIPILQCIIKFNLETAVLSAKTI